MCRFKKHFDEKVSKSKDICHITCYCGVKEIVVPVNVYGTTVSMVSVSGISGNMSDKMKAILCRRTLLNADEFDSLRKRELVSKINISKAEIHIKTLACMLKIYLEQNVPEEIFEQKNFYKNETSTYVKTALNYIDCHFMEDIKVKDVAKACNLSTSHLQHIFIELTGKGIGNKIRTNRLQYARQLIRTTNHSIKSIAITSGFKNMDYFSYTFHKEFGITPLKYRKTVSISLNTSKGTIKKH